VTAEECGAWARMRSASVDPEGFSLGEFAHCWTASAGFRLVDLLTIAARGLDLTLMNWWRLVQSTGPKRPHRVGLPQVMDRLTNTDAPGFTSYHPDKSRPLACSRCADSWPSGRAPS